MSTPIVQLSSIRKQFGNTPVLNGLDWQVMPGQVVGLRRGCHPRLLALCLGGDLNAGQHLGPLAVKLG